MQDWEKVKIKRIVIEHFVKIVVATAVMIALVSTFCHYLNMYMKTG